MVSPILPFQRWNLSEVQLPPFKAMLTLPKAVALWLLQYISWSRKSRESLWNIYTAVVLFHPFHLVTHITKLARLSKIQLSFDQPWDYDLSRVSTCCNHVDWNLIFCSAFSRNNLFRDGDYANELWDFWLQHQCNHFCCYFIHLCLKVTKRVARSSLMQGSIYLFIYPYSPFLFFGLYQAKPPQVLSLYVSYLTFLYLKGCTSACPVFTCCHILIISLQACTSVYPVLTCLWFSSCLWFGFHLYYSCLSTAYSNSTRLHSGLSCSYMSPISNLFIIWVLPLPFLSLKSQSLICMQLPLYNILLGHWHTHILPSPTRGGNNGLVGLWLTDLQQWGAKRWKAVQILADSNISWNTCDPSDLSLCLRCSQGPLQVATL